MENHEPQTPTTTPVPMDRSPRAALLKRFEEHYDGIYDENSTESLIDVFESHYDGIFDEDPTGRPEDDSEKETLADPRDHEWLDEIDPVVSEADEVKAERKKFYKDMAINTTKQLGAYALYMPGTSYAVGSAVDFKQELVAQHVRRKAYKKEHGTIISNTVKHWQKSTDNIRDLSAKRSVLKLKHQRYRAARKGAA